MLQILAETLCGRISKNILFALNDGIGAVHDIACIVNMNKIGKFQKKRKHLLIDDAVTHDFNIFETYLIFSCIIFIYSIKMVYY